MYSEWLTCFSRFYSEHCFTDDARQICLKTSWKVVIKAVCVIAIETDRYQ